MLRKTLLLGSALVLGAFADPALSQSASAVALPAREGFISWAPDDQIIGYRNIERIFSTHTVSRGASVRALPVAARTIAPIYSEGGDNLGVDQYITSNKVAGLLVIHNGEIVLERYGLGEGGQDRWTSFSVGKSITSTLVGAAVKDGYIASIEDPIARYIPELASSAYGQVKISDVLKMRSGVRWNEDYEDPQSDVGRLASSMANDTGTSLVELMASLPADVLPGERFLYSTGESNLLGVLVTRATGKSLSDYLAEKIWVPYGMEREAVWITDGGTEVGGCCISMTLRDYGRFAQFMLGGGQIGDTDVLPENWVRDATVSYSGAVFGDIGYGYQWWPHDDGSYEAIGIFGQSILIDPTRNLIIVTSSAWPEAGWSEGYTRQAAFAAGVREAVDSSKH